MSVYHDRTDLSILIDDDASAGEIAQDIWAALGRRRALIVSTKLRRLAELPAGYEMSRPARPAANGNGHNVA